MANFVSYSDMQAIMNAIGLKFDTVEGAYVLKGSVAFASLPSSLTEAMVGNVYNVNEEFTTDSRFVEGSGKKYPAGTNVAIADVGTAGSPSLKFDVLGNFIDYEAINTALANLSDSITGKFDVTEAYEEGDIVMYNNKLYTFNADHAAGAWTGTDVDATTVLDVLDAAIAAAGGDITALEGIVADLAPAFSDATAYAAGDYVTYNGKIYKFTAAHSAGTWTGSDAAEQTTILKNLVAATKTVNDRVDTVVGELAPEFSDSTAYSKDDVVVKDDVLYKFTADHAAGAWTGSDASAVKVSELEPKPLTTAQQTALIALIDTPTTT